jgi:hypothetical protein
MTPPAIEVHQKIDGEWKFYCYLIRGADAPGAHPRVAKDWAWAKKLVAEKPDEWRIHDPVKYRRP